MVGRYLALPSHTLCVTLHQLPTTPFNALPHLTHVTTDTFADRRAKALRGAIRGRSPFFRPSLPAVLVENNSDTCPTDKEGRRLLPDGSQWVVGAWADNSVILSSMNATISHKACDLCGRRLMLHGKTVWVCGCGCAIT